MQPACSWRTCMAQVTWKRAREQERRGERAKYSRCCCFGREIAVADEMLLALLALLARMALLALLKLLALLALLALRGSGE